MHRESGRSPVSGVGHRPRLHQRGDGDSQPPANAGLDPLTGEPDRHLFRRRLRAFWRHAEALSTSGAPADNSTDAEAGAPADDPHREPAR